MPRVKVNINDYVWVKLTANGIKRLEDEHNKLYKGLNMDFPPKFKLPAIDEQGYSKFQLWILMVRLGGELTWGGNLPFETTIEFDLDNVT